MVSPRLAAWSDCGLIVMHEDGTGSWLVNIGSCKSRHDHVSNASGSVAINTDGEAMD